MRLQKYRPRIAPMPRIEQPLTQIHFIPSQLFLVNVRDMTMVIPTLLFRLLVQRLFPVVVQLEKVQIFAVRLSAMWH
jgi:hypothetical protein